MESVDKQTYTDWNHILVNDNNSEVREKIHHGTYDERKRFWIDLMIRTHYWGAFARNVGVMVAFSYLPEKERDIENEWIVFHDDDNFWKPNHLQSLVDALNENPNATLIASDARWIGVNDPTWNEIRMCKVKQGGIDLGQLMYKNLLFKRYGYFNPRPRKKQRYDWELISRMINGEGDRFIMTHKPTFMMSYRKK